MALDKAREIVNDIRANKVKPIYFFHGEESYYIDALSKYIEEKLLKEEEKAFNQMVLYGREVTIEDIVNNAKRYPMGADRQVIIVKEAQDLSRTIDNFLDYALNPQPSTVVVFCYKYKKLDGKKKIAKAVAKNGVLFESKKMYDNQIPDWIKRILAAKGFTITNKAALMLVEFIGTDLSRINNELEKLQLILQPGQQITDVLIEENIGFSKDFNNFELQKSIGSRDVKKSFAIIQHFAQNPKNHSIIATTAILYMFFSKLLIYHGVTNKANAAKEMGVGPYFMNDYITGAKNFNMKQCSSAIDVLRKVDLKSKGVGASLEPADLFKELLVGILG